MNQIGYHSIALEILYNFAFDFFVIGVEGEPRIRRKVRTFSGVNESRMKWVHRFEFNILAEIKCEMNQTGYQWIALEMIYNFAFELTAIRVEGEPQIDLKVGPFSGINERSLVERPKQKETTPIAQCSWLIQLQVETDSTWWKISADISK